jgi:hypothetical protein
VVANGRSNCVVIDRSGERVSKRHELVELDGALFCRLLRRFRGSTLGVDVAAAGSPRVSLVRSHKPAEKRHFLLDVFCLPQSIKRRRPRLAESAISRKNRADSYTFRVGYNTYMRLVSLAILGLAVSLTALAAQSPPKKTAPSAAQKSPQTAPSAAALAVLMPPIPNPGFSPGRPVDVTRAVYKFAAEHPEVLKYVPCYCGCETSGHPHNESCFVKRRDPKGNVVEWDTHGYG